MASLGKGPGLSINVDRSILNPSTSQPPAPAGGLFGSSKPTTTSQPQGTSLFGTSSTSQPQQQTGGLFGTSTSTSQTVPAATTATAAPSMFGNQNQTAGGGLFGTGGTSQAQPAPSLFGSTLNQANNQGQSAQQEQKPSGGLFGGLGTASNNSGAPSLFGNLNASQNPSILSGSTAVGQQSQQQPTFLSSITTNQNAASSTTAQPNRLGGSLLGRSTAQQTIPGVKIDVSQMRGTTRFSDLHEELQKQVEQVDNFIQQQISYSAQCSALLPAHEQSLTYIPNDAEYVAHKLDTTELSLGNDSVAIAKLKDLVKDDTNDAKLSFRAIDNLKLPQQFHYSGMMWSGFNGQPTRSAMDNATTTATDASDDVPSAADLLSYFSRRADAFSQKVAEYERNTREIETHLRTVETTAVAQTEAVMAQAQRANVSTDGRSSSLDDELRGLAAVLADFERGILSVASKVGSAREHVVELVMGSEEVLGKPGYRHRMKSETVR